MIHLLPVKTVEAEGTLVVYNTKAEELVYIIEILFDREPDTYVGAQEAREHLETIIPKDEIDYFLTHEHDEEIGDLRFYFMDA